jgi:peroxiredoxin
MLAVAPDLEDKTTEAGRGRRDQKERANLDHRQGDAALWSSIHPRAADAADYLKSARTAPHGSSFEATGDETMASVLAPGIAAPGFKLRVTPDQYLSLGDLVGKPIILAFYPADWSPVCGDQMALYNQVLPEFRRHGAELIGISVDGAWCHEAFSKDRHLHFPLLADFEPKGDVAKRYGAYRFDEGVCERALFVIDRKGAIFWSHLSPIAVNPGADGILDALEQLPVKVSS